MLCSVLIFKVICLQILHLIRTTSNVSNFSSSHLIGTSFILHNGVYLWEVQVIVYPKTQSSPGRRVASFLRCSAMGWIYVFGSEDRTSMHLDLQVHYTYPSCVHHQPVSNKASCTNVFICQIHTACKKITAGTDTHTQSALPYLSCGSSGYYM